MKILPKITLESCLDDYIFISKEDEDLVIQENWCYDYDIWDDYEPDMRVKQEWVGKKVKDCGLIKSTWKYFKKPKEGAYEI